MEHANSHDRGVAVLPGEETIFRFPIAWVVGLAVVLNGVLVAWAVHQFRTHGSYRVRALIVTVVSMLLALGALSERLVVSGCEIEDSGMLRSTKGFSYDAVSYIHVTTGRDWRNRPTTLWEVHYKPELEWKVDEIQIGDLWKMKTDTITTLLKRYGVEFR